MSEACTPHKCLPIPHTIALWNALPLSAHNCNSSYIMLCVTLNSCVLVHAQLTFVLRSMNTGWSTGICDVGSSSINL